MNGLEPEAYLREVLTRIGEHPINAIDDLLPWNIARTSDAQRRCLSRPLSSRQSRIQCITLTSASARLAERQERSAPLVENLRTWLIEERAKPSANNPVAKAIHYGLARWPALTLFLTDGRVCLSNNAAERALRGIAVGRHNWTFAGSDRGGERAAAIYTLIETCLCRPPNYAEWLRGNSPFQRFFEASRGLRFDSIRHSLAIYSASRKASRRSLARKRVGFPRSYGLSLAKAASFKAR